jgi:hypothetical protein
VNELTDQQFLRDYAERRSEAGLVNSRRSTSEWEDKETLRKFVQYVVAERRIFVHIVCGIRWMTGVL